MVKKTSKTTTTVEAPPVPQPPAGPENAIRIRMYLVGFGDCFLLTFPGGRHVLIDCGVHPGGDNGTLESAAKNIAEVTGGKLDLLIATHAHRDHISGFGAYEAIFSAFTVSDVWLPWTENPDDGDAVRLQNSHQAMAKSLADHFAASPMPADQQKAVNSVLALASGNERALALLKSGLKGAKVGYLSAGSTFDSPGGIPGLSARVMGPPRDVNLLGKMDPPTDQHFLRADGNGGGTITETALEPFDKSWRVEGNTNPYYAAIGEREKNLLAVAATNAQILAFALDDNLNNTSIVTLLSYGGQHLLFPGDAQYGNWKNWIEKPDAKELLAKVTFFKVAHHGSLNATPRSVVEGMTDKGFSAMIPTSTKPFKSIPLAKLMEAVTSKASAAVRSDAVPEKLAANFERGEFWVDCILPVKA